MSTIYTFVWLFTMSFGTPAFGPAAPPAATIEVVQPRSGDSGARAVVPQAPSKRDLVGEKFFRRY